ncbi:MAG: hypothetical protein COA78_28460 [Blastopirellula sp.]|nr:MAG: hypothetical protein COA78_28460 [Blastopirellula sp.]
MIIPGMTRELALQMAANAVNASHAVGMGHLHYTAVDYTPEDMVKNERENGTLDFDYFEGRMVKLTIRCTDGKYQTYNGSTRADYQSWAGTYPTYVALVQSVLPEFVFEESEE